MRIADFELADGSERRFTFKKTDYSADALGVAFHCLDDGADYFIPLSSILIVSFTDLPEEKKMKGFLFVRFKSGNEISFEMAEQDQSTETVFMTADGRRIYIREDAVEYTIFSEQA